MKHSKSRCDILVLFMVLAFFQSSALAQNQRDVASTTRAPSSAPNEALEMQLYQVSQALLQDPQNPELLLKKGVFLSELGRLPQAAELFDALRLAYPEHPAPYANLASVYARQGRLEQAREMLLKSDVLGGNRFQTQLSLASVNLELALVALNKANEIKPGDPRTLQKLQNLTRFIAESNKAPFTMEQSARAADEVTPLTPRRAMMSNTQGAARATMVSPNKSADRLTLAAPDIGEGAEPAQVKRSSAGSGPALAGAADPRRGELLAALDAWVKDWSARQFDTYAAHCSSRFQPADGSSREAWSAYKQQVMERAKFIHVTVNVRDVAFDHNNATVTFDQSFRSDRHADHSRKQIQWVMEDGGWKIAAEKSLD